MNAVVAVTVKRVLLFVLHVCMLRNCESARASEMLVWGMWVVHVVQVSCLAHLTC